MNAARGRRRPWELTVVVVLSYLQGVGDVAIGILVLLARYDDDVRADGDAFAGVRVAQQGEPVEPASRGTSARPWSRRIGSSIE